MNDPPLAEKMRELDLLCDEPEGEDDKDEEERHAHGGSGTDHDKTAEDANEDEEDLDVSLLQAGQLAGDEVEGEGEAARGVQKEEDGVVGDGIQEKAVDAVMKEEVNGGEEEKGINRFGEPLNADDAIQQLV